MPSTPSFPTERQTAERQSARREYESYDWYEELLFTIPAGTAFVEAGRFSGRPERLIVRTNPSSAEIRLRKLGGPPGDPIRLRVNEPFEMAVGEQIVEARDPAGVGGQAIFITGLHSSRNIDVRSNRPGPRRRGAGPSTAPSGGATAEST